ncbi:MAG TPA: hypothetical protein VE046_04235 [Steroidobacteraceae bacterium]|nr:hypothetical protein [Steroidobacteraceae bacterium]
MTGLGKKLNVTGSRTILTTLDEVRSAAVAVASQAQRMLTIFTQDLEPLLYDQNPFLDAAKRLVLARSYAKVRILVADPSRTIWEGNKFFGMARRLTGCIEMRNIHKTVATNPSAFLIADDRALLYRLQSSRWEGIAEMADQAVVRKYLDYFDEAWRASEPEAGLRQMHL